MPAPPGVRNLFGAPSPLIPAGRMPALPTPRAVPQKAVAMPKVGPLRTGYAGATPKPIVPARPSPVRGVSGTVQAGGRSLGPVSGRVAAPQTAVRQIRPVGPSPKIGTTLLPELAAGLKTGRPAPAPPVLPPVVAPDQKYAQTVIGKVKDAVSSGALNLPKDIQMNWNDLMGQRYRTVQGYAADAKTGLPAATKSAMTLGQWMQDNALYDPNQNQDPFIQAIHAAGNYKVGSKAVQAAGLGGFLPTKILGNALDDAINMPASAPTALADLGVGAAKASFGLLHGNLKPDEEFAKGFVQGFAHPIEHPLNTALALWGAASPASLAGRTALERAGIVEPADLTRPGQNLVANINTPTRYWSKYPNVRAVEKAVAARPAARLGQMFRQGFSSEPVPMKPPISERIEAFTKSTVGGRGGSPFGSIQHLIRRRAAANGSAYENMRRNSYFGRNQADQITSGAITGGPRTLDYVRTDPNGDFVYRNTKTGDLTRSPTRLEGAAIQSKGSTPVPGHDYVGWLSERGILEPKQIEPIATKEINHLERQQQVAPETNVKLKEDQANNIAFLKGMLQDTQFMAHPEGAISAARQLAEQQHAVINPALDERKLGDASRARLVTHGVLEMGGHYEPTPVAVQYEQAVRNAAAAQRRLNQLGEPVSEEQLRAPETRLAEAHQQNSVISDLEAQQAQLRQQLTTAPPHMRALLERQINNIGERVVAITSENPRGEDQARAELASAHAEVMSGTRADALARNDEITRVQRQLVDAQKEVKRLAEHKDAEALVHPDGRLMTQREIRTDMANKGLGEPLFLSHEITPMDPQRAMALKSYIKSNPSAMPIAQTHVRTGSAIRRGLVNRNWDAVVQQFRRDHGNITAHDAVMEHLKQGMIINTDPAARSPFWNSGHDAALSTQEEGVKAQNPHDVPVTPLRLGAQWMKLMQLEHMKDILTPLDRGITSQEMDHLAETNDMLRTSHQQPFTDMTDPKHGPGAWVLFPTDYLKVLKGLETPPDDIARAMRTYTTNYRRAHYALHVPRLLGLPLENWAFRAAPNAIFPGGPGNSFFRKVDEYLNSPEANTPEYVTRHGVTGRAWADELKARSMMHQYIGQAFSERTYSELGGLAKDGGGGVTSHTVKGVLTGWKTATDTIMHTEAKLASAPFERAAMSRLMIKEIQRASGMSFRQVLKLEGDAFKQAADGLTSTDTMHRLADAMDRIGGRYQGFSPGLKKWMWVSPAGAWYVNSLKFIYAVMPHDHPFTTGLYAAASTATQQQRQQQGLLGPWDTNWNPNELEASQQGSVVTPFGLWNAGYYSPFGAVSEGPLQFASSLLPQVTGVTQAIAGNDPFGRRLTVPGLPYGAEIPSQDKFGAAVYAFLDSFAALTTWKKYIGEASAAAGVPILGGGRSTYTGVPFQFRPYATSSPPAPFGPKSILGLFFKVQKPRLASGAKTAGGSSSSGGGGSVSLGSPTNPNFGGSTSTNPSFGGSVGSSTSPSF